MAGSTAASSRAGTTAVTAGQAAGSPARAASRWSGPPEPAVAGQQVHPGEGGHGGHGREHEHRCSLPKQAARPSAGPHRVAAWQIRRPTGRPPARSPSRPGSTGSAMPAGRVIYVGKAKNLRSRLNSYFADFAGLHPRTQACSARPPRVDWTVVAHRGRGAPAGVLLDQGVRPAVQRPVPGRQELPLPRGHARRGVPPGDGDARRQAPRRPVLRPVLARLGDPRHGRHAAPGVPGADLLGRGVQAGRPDRPPVPARLHRQVLGAVRGPGRRGRAPAAGRGVLRLHVRPDGPVHQAPRRADARSGRGARSTSGPPGCGTTSRRCSGPWRSRRWCSATAPTAT